ncbi:MAG TPA: phage terminase small subunit P27 family [Tepidisphaeraceae bacterium]|nr:phage terminase small subunit P27 family [Tepidisphaeraceae bacterium]
MTDKDARKEFRRLAKLLGEMRLVGEADSNLIVRYCITWVRWRRVVQTLASNAGAEFATYKDADGKVKSVQVSALHSVARSLGEELGRAEAQLGMSPSARSRIEVAPTAPRASESDSKSRFFQPVMRVAQ